MPAPAPAPEKAPAAKPALIKVLPREQLLQEVRNSIQGEIQSVAMPFYYPLGLLAAFLVMLLLIAVYLSIIALVCYAVYCHAIYDVAIFKYIRGGRAGIIALAIYLTPLVAGPLLIFFLFKPLFARVGKKIPPVSVTRDKEPLLFEFVERICRAVGAPMPRRIDVDVNVNASAGFRRGIWSMLIGRDLVLTIGLPLVAGMTSKQLAGVLAHEFGHFQQGAGMRLSYLVRRMSFWFTRVVYERDSWDNWLEQMTQSENTIVNCVFQFVRGCVWVTRKLLWCLMLLGHLVSGFLLRQMEFDADRSETQMAGSETFAQTSQQLTLLSVAFRGAISDLHDFYREGRLGDNLPKLLMHNAHEMPQELKEVLEKVQSESKTGIFDTHPCDRDRIAAAKAMNSPGIFRMERPSILLFANFGTLARQATLAFYREEIGEQFRPEMVHAIDSLLERKSRDADAVKSLERHFQGSFSLLRPLKLADDLLESRDLATEIESIRKARAVILAEKTKYEDALKEYDQADTILVEIEQASALIEAEFTFPSDAFSVPLSSYQRIQDALRSAHGRTCGADSRMRAMESAITERIQIGLRLLDDPQVASKIENIEALREEVPRLLKAQGLLVELFPKLMEYRLTGASLQTLLTQLETHRDKISLINAIKSRMLKLHNQLGEIFKRLVLAKYPLDHAQSSISIADYLLPKLPTDEDLGGLLNSYAELMEKLPVLYLRLTSQLGAVSEQVESVLGFPPMADVPEKKPEKEG
jgi:Zn-dependent protease with chaperone function